MRDATTGPAELGYAKAPRWHQGQRFRFALRVLVAVVVIVFSIPWIGFGWYWVSYRMPVLLAERQARVYQPPQADQIVYDNDPATFPKLLASGPPYVSNSRWFTGNQYALAENAAYDRYYRALGVGVPGAQPAAFLHELKSPKGLRRIVVVGFSPVHADTLHRLVFQAYVLDPANKVAASPLPPKGLSMYGSSGDKIRIHYGQLDPADASRITIAMDYNGQRIQIAGQLNDDETVTLTPSAGQLADFANEWWWMPPGVAIPPTVEPSYFADIATTKPTPAFAPSPPGIRIRLDANGKFVNERTTTRPIRSTTRGSK